MPSPWLAYVKDQIGLKTEGKFSMKDPSGLPILLVWEKVNPKLPRLNEKIISLSHLLIEAYLNIELDFAKKHPEAILEDMFLKSLEPLLKDGPENIDWEIAKEQIKNILSGFFTQMNWSLYAQENDIQFFVEAQDITTAEQLGMIQFIISPHYAHGTVKIELYDGVSPRVINRDIEKILISSIFKLLPATERIFFHTRITNSKGIEAHQALGFSKFSGNLTHWIDLEYLIEKSNLLKEFSCNFID